MRQGTTSTALVTQFDHEIEEIILEIKDKGLVKVAKKRGILLTKKGKVDKRTRIGRVLYYRLEQEDCDLKGQSENVSSGSVEESKNESTLVKSKEAKSPSESTGEASMQSKSSESRTSS